ncbi:MAG: hypothetical protein U0359_24860 [Byssovorax sp.]
MMDWFKAGGFGMFIILALGAAGVGYGVSAWLNPTRRRQKVLRSFPALILSAALFTFGTDLWAVNTHLGNETFLKTIGVTPDQTAFVAMMGLTEAAQALTLGGVLAMIVIAIKMVVDGKVADSAAS